MEGRFQTKHVGREVQRLLNTSTGIVKDSEQDVITLTFQLRAIRLRENRANLLLIEITDQRNGCLFRRYVQDRGALRSRQAAGSTAAAPARNKNVAALPKRSAM